MNGIALINMISYHEFVRHKVCITLALYLTLGVA